MKLIIATVPPERIEAVQTALESNSAESIYAAQMRDLRAFTQEHYRGAVYHPFRPVFRVEALVVNEMLLEDTLNAVANACCSPSQLPDSRGTILVVDVKDWIPIRGPEPHLATMAA